MIYERHNIDSRNTRPREGKTERYGDHKISSKLYP